jgi:hypothetical protein
VTLKDALQQWHDADGAAFQLALALGVLEPTVDFTTQSKHLFWTDNPVGVALSRSLDCLVEAGVLDRDEDDRYRWNASFKVS